MISVIKVFIALVIVYLLLSKNELYIPRSILDDEWKATRNTPTRKADPFNTCSPESFDECAKVAFPLLSRY
jgi:hypothetical protein